jgi:hypothetical protein
MYSTSTADHLWFSESCWLLVACMPQVGLDLSFVGFIFLMEPLANKAVEQQVGRVGWEALCSAA